MVAQDGFAEEEIPQQSGLAVRLRRQIGGGGRGGCGNAVVGFLRIGGGNWHRQGAIFALASRGPTFRGYVCSECEACAGYCGQYREKSCSQEIAICAVLHARGAPTLHMVGGG